MGSLTLISAGAGAGKTTKLCSIVAEQIAGGRDPATVLATTFTKKAAAELKNRIRATLLSNGVEAEQVDRLELALIGTVHSIADQLLRRYALELGLSPEVRVMDESASAHALRDLSDQDPFIPKPELGAILRRLEITDVRERAIQILNAKRANRIDDEAFTQQMWDSAAEVCERLAEAATNEAVDIETFQAAAASALRDLKANGCSTINSKKAVKTLQGLSQRGTLTWSAFAEAGKIEAGKKVKADGRKANDILQPIREMGLGVLSSGELSDDIRRATELLISQTLFLQERFAEYKRERALLDFTDLETHFLELLEHPEIREDMEAERYLVLVDEFQDTNPIQLAIFQRLRELSEACFWVGDAKQAIYGFRGADATLVANVWEEEEDNAMFEALPKNYRSQGGLVRAIGDLFEPTLGPSARQEPDHPPAPHAIERWSFADLKRNQNFDYPAVAGQLRRFQQESNPRHRWGDVAILLKTNSACEKMSAALEAEGIPCALERPGLFRMREAAAALAGLRIVADRADALAAATLIHLMEDRELETTPSWLAERLEARQNAKDPNPSAERPFTSPWPDHPTLLPLEGIDPRATAPAAILQEVIEALRLPERIATWGRPEARAANLDSLCRHASAHEEEMSQRAEAATLVGLIWRLERLQEEGQDYRFPAPNADAVSVLTYHSAKGLEWPIVLLGDLHDVKEPRLWDQPLVSNHGGPGLSTRRLRYWLWPFGATSGPFKQRRKLAPVEAVAANSTFGRMRQERETAEGHRLLYVGATRAKQTLILIHKDKPEGYPWLQSIGVVDAILPAEPGTRALENYETNVTVRALASVETVEIPVPKALRWLAGARNTPPPPPPIARYHAPSQVDGTAPGVTFELLPIGDASWPAGLDQSLYAAYGDAIHAYLAALPSMRALDEEATRAVAERCLAPFELGQALDAATLMTFGSRLHNWVQATHPDAIWRTEADILAPRSGGGYWRGTADLILELPDGAHILIDHKSAPVSRKTVENKANEYVGQLEAYQDGLSALGIPITASFLHFPSAGLVARMRKPDNQ